MEGDRMVDMRVEEESLMRLMGMALRQYPFATARALNDVAILFQKVQRRHQARVFTVRRKTWWRQAVKIPKDGFADHKKGRLEATVLLDPKADRAGKKHYEIFARQEFDKRRTPIKGRKSLAIPRKGAKKDMTGVVLRRERPKRVFEKTKRAFIVHFPSGAKGMFRRVGPRSKQYVTAYSHRALGGGRKLSLRQDPNVEFMYFMIPDADINPVYDWYENAQRVWRGNWERAFNVRLKKAFATMK